MDNDVKGIIDILKDGVKEEFDSMIKVNWIMLQQAASKFLSEQASFQASKVQTQKISQIVSMNAVTGYENFSSDTIKRANESKRFYKALFEFDIALTNYLGEVPKRGLYVFFDQDGKPSTYDMSMEDLANMSQGRGRIAKLNKNGLRSIEEQIDKKAQGDLEHINQGACAAIGVNKRLERFYTNRGKQTIVNKKTNTTVTKNAQKQGGLLMWKTAGAWKVVKVANQGVIGEAYASFLMTRHKSRQDYLVGVETGSSPYYSHSLIAKFYKYLSTVTNNPAIVEEDIYTEWAQYAVKGQKAGLPTPEQYIRTAYTILSSVDEIAPQNLKNMITLAFEKDSALAPFLGEFTNKEFEKGLDKIMKNSGFQDAKMHMVIPFQ